MSRKKKKSYNDALKEAMVVPVSNKNSKTTSKDNYLNALQESLVDFDQMTVHKGPAADVLNYDGKTGELDHHRPVKNVVDILERMYTQESLDGDEMPSGMGDGRDKDPDNSNAVEQDLSDIATTTGEEQSSEAESGGAGSLPNGSQDEGFEGNLMDSDDSTAASQEASKSFKESSDLPPVATGENEPQGDTAITGDTPVLGDHETETDYTGGESKEKLQETKDDVWNEMDEMDENTPVLPKPDATIGDDEVGEDDELESYEEDDAAPVDPSTEELGYDDSEDVALNSDEETLEVPAAPTDDEVKNEMDDTGQDPGGSGMRSEMDEEPVGDTDLDLPDDNPNIPGLPDESNDAPNTGVTEMDEDKDEDCDEDCEDDDEDTEEVEEMYEMGDYMDMDDMGLDESLFEDDDTKEFGGSGTTYKLQEDDVADIEGIEPTEVTDDENQDATLEGYDKTIVARRKNEETIVERLIREIHGFDNSENLKENLDILDDLSIDDMFDE